MNKILKNDYTTISINQLDLDEKSYEYCINNGYFTLKDLLRIPRENLVFGKLFGIFNKVHSFNLKFYYEDEYLMFIKNKITNGAIVRLDELCFLLDNIDYQYFGLRFYNTNQLKSRLKLLISANIFSIHDLNLIQQILNVDINKMISQLNFERLDTNLSLRLEDLSLPTRVINPLLKIGIKNLGMLLLIPSYDLTELRNFGKISAEKTIEVIHSMGYKFIDEIDEKYEINNITYVYDNNPSMVLGLNDLQKHNNDTIVRIKNKEQLSMKYQQLIKEKEMLLQKEKELDLKINEAIKMLNKLYGDKYAKVK